MEQKKEAEAFSLRYTDKIKFYPELNKSLIRLANNADWKYVCQNFIYPMMNKLNSLYEAKDMLEDKDIDPTSALIEVKADIKAYGIIDSVINRINHMATKKIGDADELTIDDFE